jgi:EAL domain-containing protein (putative c-di-GMP-specific phosphodiesterase class I)
MRSFVAAYWNVFDVTGSTPDKRLRWRHPTRGMIPPAQFVPIAEESGLIVPIGQRVLVQACRQARAWKDAGLPPVRMAVNYLPRNSWPRIFCREFVPR